ncbi:MAG: bkdB, partial [Ramlibacter sp.]|nr:bkdB [Ramlibacter sp.]
MGHYTIKMPDIGEGIAEVEVVEWRVKPGDTVTEDQVLADVMTDKATVEIPSPVAGKVVSLGGKPGELMPVGAELIRLEVEGAGNVKDAPAAPAPAAQAAARVEAPQAVRSEAAHPTETKPAAVKTQPAPRVQPPTATPAPMRAPGDKPLASPAVRQRAWELGIELQFVHGSGAAGRITHGDLDVYLASRGQPRTAPASSAYARREGEEAVPVIGLRRKIAQKMQEAKRRIPHFSYVEEIDVTEIEALRKALNDRYGAQRGKLRLLPLLARAVVLAVADFPMMNARFDDDAGVVTR